MAVQYVVWGGRFRSSELAWPASGQPLASDIEGTVERYGPFDNKDAAHRAWQDNTRRNVDFCAHRLIVETVNN